MKSEFVNLLILNVYIQVSMFVYIQYFFLLIHAFVLVDHNVWREETFLWLRADVAVLLLKCNGVVIAS